MKNNIKKAPVKFWEDLLYFCILCSFLFLLQITDYHHIKFHEIWFRVYLVMANYMDFKSIQEL